MLSWLVLNKVIELIERKHFHTLHLAHVTHLTGCAEILFDCEVLPVLRLLIECQ